MINEMIQNCIVTSEIYVTLWEDILNKISPCIYDGIPTIVLF